METHEHLVVDFVRFSSIAHGWRLSCITGRPLCAIHGEIRLTKIAIVVERREAEDDAGGTDDGDKVAAL